MVSKVVKLATMNHDEQRKILNKKLEILKLKTQLVQEQLDILDSNHYYSKKVDEISKSQVSCEVPE
jgi:hypothetical protein